MIFLIIDVNKFHLNVFLPLKIMNFENMALTKH